jgi:hypothetical protein
MNDEAPRGLGDNQPPEPTPLERGEELVAACNLWTATVPTIADAEQAGRAQAFIDQLRLETAAIEAAQKAERKPHDDAIVAIRARYRQPLELLGIALDRMKWLAGGWLDREKARIGREAAERERLAAEAEVAARVARETAARPGATVEDEAAEAFVSFELGALPAARPGLLLGVCGVVPDLASGIALELASNGRWRAIQSCRDLPDRPPLLLKAGNAAAILDRELCVCGSHGNTL